MFSCWATWFAQFFIVRYAVLAFNASLLALQPPRMPKKIAVLCAACFLLIRKKHTKALQALISRLGYTTQAPPETTTQNRFLAAAMHKKRLPFLSLI